MKIKSNSLVGEDLEGRVLVMRESALAKPYRTFENRLHRATGGFGCSSSAVGSAIFATCLGDGEQTRWTRAHFEGWLTEEQLNELLLKEKSMTIEQFMAWQKLAVK